MATAPRACASDKSPSGIGGVRTATLATFRLFKSARHVVGLPFAVREGTVAERKGFHYQDQCRARSRAWTFILSLKRA
jgi:hypothetical protein